MNNQVNDRSSGELVAILLLSMYGVRCSSSQSGNWRGKDGV